MNKRICIFKVTFAEGKHINNLTCWWNNKKSILVL